MELRQLATFVTIADLGGFRRAAEELCISQPALSQQMRQLETELGVVLFERDRRPVALTQAGEALLVHAQQVLRTTGTLREEMRDFARNERGYVRVGTVYSNGAPWTGRLLGAFHQQYPKIEIEVSEHASELLAGLVADRQLDVACLSLPGRAWDHHPGLDYAIVRQFTMALAVSRSHRLAGRTDVRIRDLADERFITPAHSTVSKVLYDAFAEHGLEPQVRLRISDQRLLLELAASDVGVGLTSRLRMYDYPHLDLWAIDPIDAHMDAFAAVIWAERGLRNAAVAALTRVARDCSWLPAAQTAAAAHW